MKRNTREDLGFSLCVGFFFFTITNSSSFLFLKTLILDLPLPLFLYLPQQEQVHMDLLHSQWSQLSFDHVFCVFLNFDSWGIRELEWKNLMLGMSQISTYHGKKAIKSGSSLDSL
ncbi:hypothetical protein GmHk_16G046588 [Glycine max]|nr:hypothetical protein GmHk_16G046588 [Glycine max]